MLDVHASAPRRAAALPMRRWRDVEAGATSAGWILTLLLGGVGIALYYQLPRAGVLQGIAMNVANAVPLFAIAVAVRRFRGSDRVAWLLIGVGTASTLVANIGYYGYPLVTHRPLPFPSWVDAFWLAIYPFFLVALVVLGRRQHDHDRLGRVLDTLIISAGGAMLLWSFVLGPVLDRGGMSGFAHTVSLGYPVMDMLIFAGVVRLVVGAPRDAQLHLLVASFVAMLAADTLNTVLLTNGTYRYGGPCDGLWAASYVILAGAALHPRPITHRTTVRPLIRLRPGRFAFLVIGGAVGPILLATRPDDLPFLATATVLTFLLVMGRTGLINMHLIRAGRRLTEQAELLRFQSLHDGLTGLANRPLVVLRLGQLLERCSQDGRVATVLDIDLDGFKNINDTLGHVVGDQLLQAVATRLRDALPDTDIVARVGSDEFVVLVASVSTEAAEGVAEGTRALLRRPFMVPALVGQLSITACIGVATSRDAAADDVLRHADVALGHARAAGRDCQHTFHPTMHFEVLRRGELELDIHTALETGQLRLLYQPVRLVDDLSLTGFETLLRWHHPTHGVVSPVEFIPLLEATGQIVEVGRWVLSNACRQAAEWAADGCDTTVAVNVSARQLDSDVIVDHVAETLAATSVDARRLTLEITETTLMRNPVDTADRLRALKALGVHIAIDDFGTGYSSLAYLQRFPVDCLKIDRTFVANLGMSADADALLHVFVQLARNLGLCTTAEGVETREQLEALRREGVDHAQGFLFAAPLTAVAAQLELLAATGRVPSTG